MELFSGWRYAIRRLRTGWRFMAVAAFGVLVASTLLAMTPIYTAAMSDLGLRFRLDRELERPDQRLPHVSVDGLQMGSPTDAARAATIHAVTAARLGWLGDGVLSEDRTARLDLSFPDHAAPAEPVTVPAGSETVRQPWGAFVFHLHGWEDRIEVVEGRLPGDASAGPEVVLPESYRRHAAVGDTVLLRAGGHDDCPNVPPSEDPTQAAEEVRCEPTASTSMSLLVTVVGFVRPVDAADPRWGLFAGAWEAPDAPLVPRLRGVAGQDPRRAQASRGIGQMPLLTTAVQFEGIFRPGLPELEMRHRSGVVVDTARVGLGDVDAAIEEAARWRRDIADGLGLSAARWQTSVFETLEGFRTARSFSAVPLLIVLLQVVGIVVYYVMMVMAMLLERQSEEIGVFRSRGATASQLVGLSFVEGVVYAVPALLVAPWLAARVVALLGATPAFGAVTDGAALSVRVTPEAYLLAVAGAALALVAILLPALVAVRRGIVDVKREQARPVGRGILQRYYLDVAIVALAGVLLWQLAQRGSVFDRNAVGGWASDPLLLLAPLAITAAVSMMVLRFYPPLVRLAVRTLLVFRGTATAVGLRRTGRAPAAYARVALLVIMAVAVGTFAASYGPTVEQSFAQRARYEAGVDLRGPLRDQRGDVEAQIAALEQTPGVLAARGVYRGQIEAPSGRTVALLAIDPAMAGPALWWREDFAAVELADVMRLLSGDVPPGGGYLLPEQAQAVEVRMFSETPGRASFRARFRDAEGVYRDTLMEIPETPGRWSTARAAVPEHGTPPFTFAGFLVSDRPAENLRIAGSVSMDNLSVVLRNSREILERFEGPMRWMMLAGAGADETFEVEEEAGINESRALTWTYSSTISARGRVLAPGDPAVPLSAVMNGPAMGEFGTGPGGLGLADFAGLRIPLFVRAAVDLFPTMAPEDGIVVVNFDHLRAATGLAAVEGYERPTELWVDLDPVMPLSDQRALLALLQGPEGAPQLTPGARLLALDVDTSDSDPTLQAAGSAILAVAFVAVLALCTVGFVTTMVVGARARATEFAVLRAIGSSRAEILRALFVEWALVLVAGAAIGVLVGRQVARIMLGFLNVTEEGDPVVPPFELHTDWATLGIGLGALASVVCLSLLVVWLASMRRAPTTELRVTQ